MTFFQKIINWFKAKFFKTESGEELTEVIVDAETEEIKEISFNFFTTINGYFVRNVVLNFNGYIVKIEQIDFLWYLASKVTLTSKNVDFDNLKEIDFTADLVSADGSGEIIHISGVTLNFDEAYVNFGRIFYKITPNGLGLIPITFNATVEDYKVIFPINI